MRRHLLWIGSVALAVALTLAACGGGSDSGGGTPSSPSPTPMPMPMPMPGAGDSIDPLLMILIGHPYLEEKLQRPLFRNINQRVLLRYRLPAMDEKETASYIAHHLARVGGQPEAFSAAAVQAVYKTSGGICRTVNSLCLAALNLGARQQLETLTEEQIYQVSNEI